MSGVRCEAVTERSPPPSAYAEYVLMESSQAYHTIMATVHEKIYLSKVVIEFCEDEPNGTYEDLLNRIQVRWQLVVGSG